MDLSVMQALLADGGVKVRQWPVPTDVGAIAFCGRGDVIAALDGGIYELCLGPGTRTRIVPASHR